MARLLPSLPDASPDDREPRVVGVGDDEADDLIAALQSETARGVVSELHDEPATTSELADELDTSIQNVQYHLSNLSEADVVEVVDTAYSEKGREMNVYAPADEPLVLLAGGSESSSGLKSALMRLLGGYGVIGLAAFAVGEFLSRGAAPRRVSDDGTAGDDAGVTTEDAADGQPTGADAGSEAARDGVAERVDLLADALSSLADPGVVFFVGAAIVFTVAWAYWYRTARSGR